MTSIAFCDDDMETLTHLRSLADKYCARRGRALDCAAFQSPLELLAAAEQGVRFDVLFLDILMPGQNGMDAAAELRALNADTKIIFLTTSDEYAVRSYSVGAYFYQLKPIEEDAFFRLMDSVLDQCDKEDGSSLILQSKDGVRRVPLRDLEYCEVMHRTLYFHMADGQVIECAGRMDDLDERLQPDGGFMRVHRSYLVNLRMVRKFTAKALHMASGTEIPIPRGKYAGIKDAFLRNAFENGELML